MTAIRLARGISKRSKVIKFDGGYHGHFDSMLVKAGSGLATSGLASSAGVPEAFAADTIVLPFDDEAALEQAFIDHKDEIACVALEPVPGNNGLLQQRQSWLQRIRTLCNEQCTLLLFDEVISGFRTCYGGVDGWLGVQPDLTPLGKIVGGGGASMGIIWGGDACSVGESIDWVESNQQCKVLHAFVAKVEWLCKEEAGNESCGGQCDEDEIGRR